MAPQSKELSHERCDISSNIVGVRPTHRKIHLSVRADERWHKVIFIKPILSTYYLKGWGVCNNAPQTTTNDVACRASILSDVPAALNIPCERRSRRRGQRDANKKTKSIAPHKFLRLNRAAFHIVRLVEGAKRTGHKLLPRRSAFTGSRHTHARLRLRRKRASASQSRIDSRAMNSVTRCPRWPDWRRGPYRPWQLRGNRRRAP